MTRMRIIFILTCWVFAALGGGFAFLTILPTYITGTQHLQKGEMESAVLLSSAAMVLTAVTNVWPAQVESRRIWLGCLPAYLMAGVPVLLLVTTWIEQQTK